MFIQDRIRVVEQGDHGYRVGIRSQYQSRRCHGQNHRDKAQKPPVLAVGLEPDTEQGLYG